MIFGLNSLAFPLDSVSLPKERVVYWMLMLTESYLLLRWFQKDRVEYQYEDEDEEISK